MYNILVPTHVEFALPSKYQNLSAKEKPAIDLVNSKIGNNVTPVDAYSILKNIKQNISTLNRIITGHNLVHIMLILNIVKQLT